MQQSRDARALRCPSCGGTIEITQPLASVRCHFCGADCPVPKELRVAIRNARAEQELAEVKLAVQQAVVESADRYRTQGPRGYVAMAAVSVVGAVVSVQHGIGRGLSVGPSVVTALTMVTGAVAMLVAMRTRRRSWLQGLSLIAPSDVGPGKAPRCPGCGAPLDVNAGDPVIRCAHCRVTSLLPASVLSLRAQRRRVILAAERERANASSNDLMRRMQWVTAIMFSVLLVGSLLSWLYPSI